MLNYGQFMMNANIANFKNEKQIVKFYDDWYSNGYMDEWPAEKKKRIFELIESLNLPSTGEILDFGCGNGEFTGVLKKALPKWDVYGADISSVAINNAKKRHPDCIFFLLSDLRAQHKTFDFLFSHHVLEHVDDIEKIWRDIDQYLKKQARCLHVLPCGNPGSFEHNICLLRKDGIDKTQGNRFVFEDASHLRRLTTAQMDNMANQYHLKLTLGYYSLQFYGAVDYITSLSPAMIFNMLNPGKGKNTISILKLLLLCGILETIKILRFPSNAIDRGNPKTNDYKYYFLFLMLLILYPLSKLINISLQTLSDFEWKSHRNKKEGSEMYLYYERIFDLT